MRMKTDPKIDDRVRAEMNRQKKVQPGPAMSVILDRYLLDPENLSRLLSAKRLVIASESVHSLPPRELDAVMILASHAWTGSIG